MPTNPAAGRPASQSDLVNVPRLVTAYYAERPDLGIPEQRVSFGTSGHRGSSFDHAFNEWHILAIAQAICLYRKQAGIDGPLFIGADTHALGGARVCQRTGGPRGQRCSGHDFERPGVYADSRGLTRDSELQPRTKERGWRTASSSLRHIIRRRTAASSTTRPTAGPRAARSPHSFRPRQTSS